MKSRLVLVLGLILQSCCTITTSISTRKLFWRALIFSRISYKMLEMFFNKYSKECQNANNNIFCFKLVHQIIIFYINPAFDKVQEGSTNNIGSTKVLQKQYLPNFKFKVSYESSNLWRWKWFLYFSLSFNSNYNFPVSFFRKLIHNY